MDKKIYELSEIINKDLENNNLSEKERSELAVKIKPYLNKPSIVIAQANSISGNLEYNAVKAQKYIYWANLLGVDAIVFPELFLVGNPLGDALIKFPIIAQQCREWLEVIAKLSKETKIIIGFIEEDKNDTLYYNSAAVLQNGEIEKIIRKSVLSNSAEYHDSRYLKTYQGKNDTKITLINDKKVNITIGEEVYNTDISADYAINLSASISRVNKEFSRNQQLSETAKKYKTSLIYVNHVGSSECLSYDGMSRLYNADGQELFRAKAFEEEFFIVSPFDKEGFTEEFFDNTKQCQNKKFSLDYEYDMERTYKSIKQSIKDYFNKTGFERACLGLSGGLDSTVCAVLLTDVLGKENVLGVSMPSQITSSTSKNDAKELAENLGIKFIEAPIKPMFDAARATFDTLFSEAEKSWNFRYKTSYTNDNIQARSRATILWGIANEFEKCLTIATSDKSEAYMGYATINGDMTGGYAPIADVTKTKLFALAKWMNKHRPQKNVIPASIIEKRPGAELAINPKTGKPLLAEEALMPYEFLDEVIWRVENLHQTIGDMLDEVFEYEKEHKITKEQKIEWLRKFFRRMSNSAFKGTLMPPSPIVDAHSINKTEYIQPILSGINYEKTSFDDKFKILTNS